MNGRQNFDFVTIADYSADMDELGKLVANAVSQQAREIAELKRAIAAIVHAVGGVVRVADHMLDKGAPPLQVKVMFDQEKWQYVIRADTPKATDRRE